VPAAPPLKVSVPAPLAVYCQVKVACAPAAIATAAGAVVLVAAALPLVAVAVGCSGDGRTLLAPLPPTLRTTRVAVNAWPAVTLEGTDSAACSTAGALSVTVDEVTKGAVTAPPEASVPLAPAVNCSGPAVLARQVYVNACV